MSWVNEEKHLIPSSILNWASPLLQGMKGSLCSCHTLRIVEELCYDIKERGDRVEHRTFLLQQVVGPRLGFI